MRVMKSSFAMLLLAFAPLACGCNQLGNPDVVPVTGVVRLNGQPLAGPA